MYVPDMSIPVGTAPGPLDLTTYFDSGTETLGRWCFDLVDSCGFNGNNEGLPGDINTAFNLDFSTVTFHPITEGYAVNDVLFSNDFQ
ncbi:MAG: hypothetical protein KDI92_15430 [Xanthomonadales bacterium]|nr:hypothetical protein [Xanthomonadales bacterium]